MPLDDDDNPSLAPPPTTTTTTTNTKTPSSLPPNTTGAAQTTADDLTAEDMIEDEGAAAQDFRAFAASLSSSQQYRKTPGVSAQTIRKGEKDFEAHGTRAQADALEQSRAAMRDVLGYTRVHAAAAAAGGSKAGNIAKERKPFGWVRERVVVLEGSSVASQALGRAVTGQAKDRPARGRDWLLPEEALYLVERGSLDLWWPMKGLEEIFPPDGTAAVVKGEAEEEVDEYDLGIPLSLQAAYALLIGNDGERGKISLQKFQVYSNLKRCGYNVLRAPPAAKQTTSPLPTPPPTTLWQWFTSLLTSSPAPKPYGPLVQPGLYRSYASIYQQLALLPRHIPSPTPTTPTVTSTTDPFTVHFHIWKAAQKWTKLRHPPPDFQLAVVDAQDSSVPTFTEIMPLLAGMPADPGKAEWTGPGRMYARLKHGYRNVLLAVVDHGVINYMRFAEGRFGGEEVYGRFDAVAKAKGGKGGGGWKKGGGGTMDVGAEDAAAAAAVGAWQGEGR
ncbi:hypothetical protein NEMBOFW57_009777 [Staphylotrichum longicolle]|uniref:tRNA-splicing endonuclease subunit Sen54 N-terminal domain-containing protein n=1 Tax=Staphylotrichum longicolle TaxID=669026 RepID=A0AAD4EPX9_9PEZI|nr:hypothetical protein NEMBOFW57_009777 [Staphylotrichum longicolle]